MRPVAADHVGPLPGEVANCTLQFRHGVGMRRFVQVHRTQIVPWGLPVLLKYGSVPAERALLNAPQLGVEAPGTIDLVPRLFSCRRRTAMFRKVIAVASIRERSGSIGTDGSRRAECRSGT